MLAIARFMRLIAFASHNNRGFMDGITMLSEWNLTCGWAMRQCEKKQFTSGSTGETNVHRGFFIESVQEDSEVKKRSTT